MEATNTLHQDHALLRKKLSLLGSALQVAPEARFVLREMSFSLQRLLHEHMERERRVLQSASRYDPSRGMDHMAAQTLLRTVNELLLSGMRASIPLVVVRLSQVVEQLEAQMDEQERTVFPSADYAEAHDLPDATASISGTMSVNEILQRYPQTERCFEQLHINRLREGYDSVDELAWRHGMDASQFIEQLRQVATAPFPGY
jgi:hypothetical protein